MLSARRRIALSESLHAFLDAGRKEQESAFSALSASFESVSLEREEQILTATGTPEQVHSVRKQGRVDFARLGEVPATARYFSSIIVVFLSRSAAHVDGEQHCAWLRKMLQPYATKHRYSDPQREQIAAGERAVADLEAQCTSVRLYGRVSSALRIGELCEGVLCMIPVR